MKANELRIGNYINDDEGCLHKVTGFTPFEHSVRCDEEEGCEILVDLYRMDGTVRRGLMLASREANPIPLSTEILLACGFTPLSDPEFTHHHPELNILFDGEFFWLKQGKITHYLSKCEYLHKLQNGVFWVTGKELIVNIEKVKV